MHKIKKCFEQHSFFVGLSLLLFFTLEIGAMRMSPKASANFQQNWPKRIKQEQLPEESSFQDPESTSEEEETNLQVPKLTWPEQELQRKHPQLFAAIKDNLYFKKFISLVEESELAREWFKGPNKAWVKKIILVSFELLEPYIGKSGFDQLRSYIFSTIRAAFIAYDKKCYFHVDSINEECNDIGIKVDDLIRYSVSGRRIEPTLLNTLFYSSADSRRNFVAQELYDQVLEERSKRKASKI